MAMDIQIMRLEDTVRISVIGEVDVSNASELRDELDIQLASTPFAIEVDLAQVSYIDSTGIGVLVAFAHKAFEAGIAFHVTNPQRNVARVFTLLDVADKLGVRESD